MEISQETLDQLDLTGPSAHTRRCALLHAALALPMQCLSDVSLRLLALTEILQGVNALDELSDEIRALVHWAIDDLKRFFNQLSAAPVNRQPG